MALCVPAFGASISKGSLDTLLLPFQVYLFLHAPRAPSLHLNDKRSATTKPRTVSQNVPMVPCLASMISSSVAEIRQGTAMRAVPSPFNPLIKLESSNEAATACQMPAHIALQLEREMIAIKADRGDVPSRKGNHERFLDFGAVEHVSMRGPRELTERGSRTSQTHGTSLFPMSRHARGGMLVKSSFKQVAVGISSP